MYIQIVRGAMVAGVPHVVGAPACASVPHVPFFSRSSALALRSWPVRLTRGLVLELVLELCELG